MAEYITLLGAEQVSNAASTMKSAAHDMAQVVSNFESVLFQQRQWMEDWLIRFEQVVKEKEGK